MSTRISKSQKDPQQTLAGLQARKEQASGRNNGLVKAGEKTTQAGGSTALMNPWAGLAMAGAGNGMKGVGYAQEGHTEKGLANGFGGHLGGGIVELTEGDSFGDVSERATPIGMFTGGGKSAPPSPAAKSTVEAS